jgi:hypothetical protein
MLIMQAVYSDEIFLDRKINIDFNHFSGWHAFSTMIIYFY